MKKEEFNAMLLTEQVDLVSKLNKALVDELKDISESYYMGFITVREMIGRTTVATKRHEAILNEYGNLTEVYAIITYIEMGGLS